MEPKEVKQGQKVGGTSSDVASIKPPAVGAQLREKTHARQDWKGLKTIEDWKREFDKHPEWRGKSPHEMKTNKDPCARSFFIAFYKFCKTSPLGSEVTYEKRVDSLFPRKVHEWSSLKTIHDWRDEFDRHREWKGRSTYEMLSDNGKEARSFYHNFRKFCKAESEGHNDIYKKLLETVFPKKQRDWSTLRTLEEYKNEFDRHVEWAGKSRSEIKRDTKGGGSAFYEAFRKFCKDKSSDEKDKYLSLFETIFPRKHRDWSEFKTAQDWKKEFDRHPDWKGRSTTEMSKDQKSGAQAFYRAFQQFCRIKSNESVDIYKSLLESIFPRMRDDWSELVSIEDWKVEFGKHLEWKGRTQQQMRDDLSSGASAFSYAFITFCSEVAGDKAAYRAHLIGQVLPSSAVHRDISPFSLENLRGHIGDGRERAATEINKLSNARGDSYELKLPSGGFITLYSVRLTTGSVWACTRAEWRKFLDAYGLKEKSECGSNDAPSSSLIDLL